MRPIFRGQIENGRVQFDDRDSFEMYLADLEGERIEVSVRKERSKRSLRQLAYYFGAVLRTASQETGHEVDELHDFFKAKYLQKVVEINGTQYTVVGSTTELNTKQMSDYIDRVKRFINVELGISVPDEEDIEIDQLPTIYGA